MITEDEMIYIMADATVRPLSMDEVKKILELLASFKAEAMASNTHYGVLQ